MKFQQINLDLNNLSTATIKKPKLQELSTIDLFRCFTKQLEKTCDEEAKKEVIPNLIRRLILPFYIPVISLLCSFLLIKNTVILRDKFYIYSTSFLLLIFTELFIRYTGINYQLGFAYTFLPFITIFYFFNL